MKFKIIFVAFNLIIVLSFLFVFLMPVLVLGWDYSQLFWANNWVLAIIFVAIIAALNIYFALNWRLFSLLEKEDWRGLVSYLEDKVYQKHRYSRQYVRILINAYVVTANTPAIEHLEARLRAERPELVRYFALELGIPRLIRNDAAEMERYFGALADEDIKNVEWIRWNYAFALMMLHENDKARSILRDLAAEVKNPVLMVLTLYLLDAYTTTDTEIASQVEEKKKAFLEGYTPDRWRRELSKQRGNLQVLVLSKLLADAVKRLFPELASAGGGHLASAGPDDESRAPEV